MATITCPQCGKANAGGNAFCIGCGQKLEPPAPEKPEETSDTVTCSQCGKKNKPGNTFCIGCGTSLSSGEHDVVDAESEPDPEPASPTCPQCGKPFDESDTFCIFCGAQLSPGAAPNQPTAPVDPATATQPVKPLVAAQQPARPKGGRMQSETSVPSWMIIAIGVVVIVLVALLLFSVFKPSSNGGTAQPTTASTTATTSTESSASSASASSAAESARSSSAASSSASSAAAQTTSAQNGDYVLSDSSTRYYTRAELEKLSTLDLYHARNEIYARHGRGFKNEDLRAYFSAKSWYRETVSPEAFDEGVLNEFEKQNVNLMLEVEKSKGSPYLS